MPLVSVNPSTGALVGQHPEDSDSALGAKLEAARAAAPAWAARSPEERTPALRRLAGLLRERRADLARLMAVEMGKPVTQGLAEADKCAAACDYFADAAPAALRAEPIPTEAAYSAVHYRPLGTVLAIMPWNFPLWQVIRCAAPALAAGNTFALKHASNVTGCARELELLFRDAGFPGGTTQVLYTDSRRVPDLIRHPAVAAVSLTGSVPAGRQVAAVAGAALKKVVLELGGSDPFVVLTDAAVGDAARVAAQSRLLNAGQSCIAAKRFIVVDPVLPGFQAALLDHLSHARVGDPLDPETTVGPLARADLRDELQRQVDDSLAAGATCLLGGRIPGGPGAFYPPSAMGQVTPGMPAFDEELFGPVAALLSARDEAEALQLANQSAFGLGATLFTQDLERGRQLAADHLEAGNCFVNALVRSDPRLPFGGIRDSGHGRELGLLGLREFTNAKTVYVAHRGAP